MFDYTPCFNEVYWFLVCWKCFVLDDWTHILQGYFHWHWGNHLWYGELWPYFRLCKEAVKGSMFLRYPVCIIYPGGVREEPLPVECSHFDLSYLMPGMLQGDTLGPLLPTYLLGSWLHTVLSIYNTISFSKLMQKIPDSWPARGKP